MSQQDEDISVEKTSKESVLETEETETVVEPKTIAEPDETSAADVEIDEASTGEPEVVPILEAEPVAGPESDNPDPLGRVAAAGKVAAGAAITAAGVPMLVLPGPGVAVMAAGGLLTAKGVSELTGKENPFIEQIESHPAYQSAANQAQQAKDTVAAAASDAAKQVPGMLTDAGKAILDVAGNNLPQGVRDAADKMAPVAEGVKAAADKVAPVAQKAAAAAAPVAKAAGQGIADGVSKLAHAAGERLKKK